MRMRGKEIPQHLDKDLSCVVRYRSTIGTTDYMGHFHKLLHPVSNVLVVIVQHPTKFRGRYDFRGWGYDAISPTKVALTFDGSISKRPESAGCFPLLTHKHCQTFYDCRTDEILLNSIVYSSFTTHLTDKYPSNHNQAQKARIQQAS